MLEPIEDTKLTHAIDLLGRGFPRRPRRFWAQVLERIAQQNKRNDHPSVGQFLVAKGMPVGLMLTIGSRSRHADGQCYKVTNLSSWYIEPEHRRLAPLMLSSIVRASDTVFTDLTPSDRVVPMLPLLGFKPLNVGISLVALPLAALIGARDAHVSSLEHVDANALTNDAHERLAQNIELGAIAGVLNADGKHCPLLFVSRSLRHVPTAQLIYCEDNALLRKNIGAVARFLLRRGKLALVMDIALSHQAPGVHFLGRGLKFAKGGCFDNRTDYAGSELLLVGQ